MYIKDLTSKEIKLLNTDTSIKNALAVMKSQNVNALPLIENDKYCGLITEANLSYVSDPKTTINNIPVINFSVKENSNIFEALGRFDECNSDILPVVDFEGRFKGVITRNVIINNIAKICSTQIPGSIIQLEIENRDYMLSEIALIAEQNNARIINFFSYIEEKSGNMQFFMKINLEDATPILRSLERFNYKVISYYQQNNVADDIMQQKLDELLYLIEM